MIYRLNILFTAILAGFLFSYALVLGNYLSYLVQKGQKDSFFETYPAFRSERKVVIFYRMVMISQTTAALLSLVSNLHHYPFLAQLLALLLFPILVFFHAITGYLPLEEKVNSGKQLSEDEKKNYLRYNLSLHVLYGLLYFISAFWLLLGLG